jgi:hypothetical protein
MRQNNMNIEFWWGNLLESDLSPDMKMGQLKCISRTEDRTVKMHIKRRDFDEVK